ncbi:MAG: putative transposase [Lysobacterales bacterium]|jgi:putative transposase
MARKRQSEEDIIKALKAVESVMKVSDVCREYWISDATFYKWKSKFSGMEVSDAKKLRHLEDENRRLKEMVADLSLDNQALKAVLEKSGKA